MLQWKGDRLLILGLRLREICGTSLPSTARSSAGTPFPPYHQQREFNVLGSPAFLNHVWTAILTWINRLVHEDDTPMRRLAAQKNPAPLYFRT